MSATMGSIPPNNILSLNVDDLKLKPEEMSSDANIKQLQESQNNVLATSVKSAIVSSQLLHAVQDQNSTITYEESAKYDNQFDVKVVTSDNQTYSLESLMALLLLVQQSVAETISILKKVNIQTQTLILDTKKSLGEQQKHTALNKLVIQCVSQSLSMGISAGVATFSAKGASISDSEIKTKMNKENGEGLTKEELKMDKDLLPEDKREIRDKIEEAAVNYKNSDQYNNDLNSANEGLNTRLRVVQEMGKSASDLMSNSAEFYDQKDQAGYRTVDASIDQTKSYASDSQSSLGQMQQLNDKIIQTMKTFGELFKANFR